MRRKIDPRNSARRFVTISILWLIGAVVCAYLLFFFGLSWYWHVITAVGFAFTGMRFVLREGRRTVKFFKSAHVLEELKVKKVVYASWRPEPRVLTGRKQSWKESEIIYGSDVYMEGFEEPFRLPTRHLREGDHTRRVQLVYDGEVWAERWLDL